MNATKPLRLLAGKKRVFIISFLSLILNSICLSQSKNEDSLRKNLIAYTKEDSFRVNKIMDYSIAFFIRDDDEAIQLSKEALQLAKKLNWTRGTIRMLQVLAQMATRNTFIITI